MISRLKHWLKKHSSFYPFFRKWVRRVRGEPLEAHLHRLLAHRKELFFLQVGANDGISGDPLYDLIMSRPRWQGILVEPVPYLFKRLEKTHKTETRFALEQVAVTDQDQNLPFFFVSEKALQELGHRCPEWYDQVGSFERDHVLAQLHPDHHRFVVKQELPCASLVTLLERHQVDQLDLLFIDAEGAEFAILSQLRELNSPPEFVVYEHLHIKPEHAEEVQGLLEGLGYSLHVYQKDVIAVRSSTPGPGPD